MSDHGEIEASDASEFPPPCTIPIPPSLWEVFGECAEAMYRDLADGVDIAKVMGDTVKRVNANIRTVATGPKQIMLFIGPREDGSIVLRMRGRIE